MKPAPLPLVVSALYFATMTVFADIYAATGADG